MPVDSDGAAWRANVTSHMNSRYTHIYSLSLSLFLLKVFTFALFILFRQTAVIDANQVHV